MGVKGEVGEGRRQGRREEGNEMVSWAKPFIFSKKKWKVFRTGFYPGWQREALVASKRMNSLEKGKHKFWIHKWLWAGRLRKSHFMLKMCDCACVTCQTMLAPSPGHQLATFYMTDCVFMLKIIWNYKNSITDLPTGMINKSPLI